MKILAVTACPLGFAFSYIAAEALEKASKNNGLDIKVEIQGINGIQNRITQEDVENSQLVLLTKDKPIKDEERFKGLHVFRISISDIINDSDSIMDNVKQYLNKVNK